MSTKNKMSLWVFYISLCNPTVADSMRYPHWYKYIMGHINRKGCFIADSNPILELRANDRNGKFMYSYTLGKNYFRGQGFRLPVERSNKKNFKFGANSKLSEKK
jgi:hypothetical protein